MPREDSRLSFEDLQRVSQEEGVPLPVLYGLWGSESTYSKNDTAYVQPEIRAAGAKSLQTNPDKFGFGGMQVTRPTYDSLKTSKFSTVQLPDYADASDVDIARAGARLLKSRAESADGTYDSAAVLRVYKGSGVDKAFPLKDSAGNVVKDANGNVQFQKTSTAPASVNSYVQGFEFAKKYEEITSDAERAAYVSLMPHANDAERRNVAKVINSKGVADATKLATLGPVQVPQRVQNDITFEKTQESIDTAARRVVEQIDAAGVKQAGAIGMIADLFKQNPLGVGDALKNNAAQIADLQNTIAKKNNDLYNTSINTGASFGDNVNGIINRLFAKVTIDKDAARLKTLTDAQKSINESVSGVLKNSSIAEQFNTEILKVRESETARNRAILSSRADANLTAREQKFTFAQEQAQTKNDNTAANLGLAIEKFNLAQAAAKTKKDSDLLNQEKVQLQIDALIAKSEQQATQFKNNEEYAAAATKAIKSISPDAVFQFDTTKDINKQLKDYVGKDAALGANIRARIAKPEAVAGTQAEALQVIIRSDKPTVSEVAQSVFNVRSKEEREFNLAQNKQATNLAYTKPTNAEQTAIIDSRTNARVNAPIALGGDSINSPLNTKTLDKVFTFLSKESADLNPDARKALDAINASGLAGNKTLTELLINYPKFSAAMEKDGTSSVVQTAQNFSALMNEYAKRREVYHGLDKIPNINVPKDTLKVANGSSVFDLTKANDVVKLRAQMAAGSKQVDLMRDAAK